MRYVDWQPFPKRPYEPTRLPEKNQEEIRKLLSQYSIEWTKPYSQKCKNEDEHDIALCFYKALWRFKCPKCKKNISKIITTDFALVLRQQGIKSIDA